MKKVLVTGGSGLVGSALKNYTNSISDCIFYYPTSSNYNLLEISEIDNMFSEYEPDIVIHLAAIVGGLYMNLKNNENMYSMNMKMNQNMFECMKKYNVKDGIFIGTSCMYPAQPSKFPMDESQINEGNPHDSNKGYAYAKRMLELQCRLCNEELGTNYICLIPVNMYGPNDNYNLETSHAVPGIVHRMYLAKQNNETFTLYGSGTPLRQFIYSYDFAKIILLFLDRYILKDERLDKKTVICADNEITIGDMSRCVSIVAQYNKVIKLDLTKSDGCMRKTVDNTYFKSLFPEFEFTNLLMGINETYKWFTENYETCRK